MEVRTLPEAACFDPDDSSGVWRRQLREDGVDVLVSQGFSALPFRAIRERAGVRTVFCLHGLPFYEELLAISREELLRGGKSALSRWWWRRYTAPRKLRLMRRTHESARPLAEALPWIDSVVCLLPGFASGLFEGMRHAGLVSESDRRKFTAIVNPLPEREGEVDLDAKEKLVIYCGRLCNEDKRVDRLLRVWRVWSRRLPDGGSPSSVMALTGRRCAPRPGVWDCSGCRSRGFIVTSRRGIAGRR